MEKSPRRRVLVFSHWYDPFQGGAELALQTLLRELSSYQFDVITARRKQALSKSERDHHITVHRVGRGLRQDLLLFPFAGVSLARALHRKRPYDLVWASMANESGRAALLFTFLCPEVPYLLTLQEGETRTRLLLRNLIYAPIYPLIYRKAQAIHTVSHWLAARAELFSPGSRIEVVPNGLPTEWFEEGQPLFGASNYRSSFGLDIATFPIISVSRLVAKNGLDDLVRSLAYLPSDMVLLLAGDGPEKERLEQLTTRLRLNHRVRFLGELRNAEVRRLLREAFCFVRPSLVEGLGNAILEAMASRVPVIATRVGGLRELVVDGVTGIACRPRDPGSITTAVLRLRHSPDLMRSIVSGGREAAIRFDIRHVAPPMDRLLTELINARGGGAGSPQESGLVRPVTTSCPAGPP